MTQLSTDEFAMCYVLMSFVHIMGPVAHVYSSAAIEDSVTAETCVFSGCHICCIIFIFYV